MNGYRWSRPSYTLGARATGVVCPECGEGEILLRFSCLSSSFSCSACHAPFLLADLVHRLDEAQFEILAGFVGERLSDRMRCRLLTFNLFRLRGGAPRDWTPLVNGYRGALNPDRA